MVKMIFLMWFIDNLNSHRRKLKQLEAQLIQFEVDTLPRPKWYPFIPKKGHVTGEQVKGVTITNTWWHVNGSWNVFDFVTESHGRINSCSGVGRDVCGSGLRGWKTWDNQRSLAVADMILQPLPLLKANNRQAWQHLKLQKRLQLTYVTNRNP